MGNKHSKVQRMARDRSLEALDMMEPDLRHLAGLLMALELLGQGDDSVESAAISSVARCAREAAGRIDASWRTAIASMRAS